METLEWVAVPGWHAVQFYDSDAELAGTVGRYLAHAVRLGGVAIAVATDAHRRAFAMELEREGIDVEQALADGAIVSRDAAECLATFMRQGRVDERAFRASIGSIVGTAAAKGRPIRVYGEMVSVLWEAGDIPAAIELEEAWNRLRQKLRFELFCGYRRSSASDMDAVERVCALHSTVEVAQQFPPDADAPRAARHFVRDLLERWSTGRAVAADAQLVVSELATNAVVHARSPFSVVARTGDGELLLSVRDQSLEEPKLLSAPRSDSGGRGLFVVDALASDWGVNLGADGKVVWATLRSPHPVRSIGA